MVDRTSPLAGTGTPGAGRTLCNLPCRQMLGIDPDASFADMSLRDFLSVCRKSLPRDGFWGRVEQAVVDRDTLEEPLLQPDGTTVICRVRHLPGNSSLISLLARREAPTAGAKALA